MNELWSEMYVGLHVKCPVFLFDFNESWIFFERFSNDIQMANFMKMRPVGGEFHADRRTDMKLIVAFCNFANAPENRPNIDSRLNLCPGPSVSPVVQSGVRSPVHRLRVQALSGTSTAAEWGKSKRISFRYLSTNRMKPDVILCGVCDVVCLFVY